MEYTFTLKYQLTEHNADHDELVERLGAAGCTDALVGTGQPGWIALELTREAKSAEAAVTSAPADVRQAIPDAKLIEAEPGFVGLTQMPESSRKPQGWDGFFAVLQNTKVPDDFLCKKERKQAPHKRDPFDGREE